MEWDAVELPSQFMENWCYHRETLLGLSRHVDTGAPLPDALFEKLVAARTFRAGSDMLRQLYFSLLDLELHHGLIPTAPSRCSTCSSAWRRAPRVLPPLPEDRFLCGFSHIFAGGYAAGYYSYKWAEVLSADAFSAFEEAGLENPRAVAATGRRFRDTVLALGGSRTRWRFSRLPRPRADDGRAAATVGAGEGGVRDSRVGFSWTPPPTIRGCLPRPASPRS